VIELLVDRGLLTFSAVAHFLKKEVLFATTTAITQISKTKNPISQLITMTNSNQIGKNGIPEA